MNAPLPEHIRRSIETVSLDDKYALETGRAFMSGVHALVRLPMLQRQRDALVGKNTAGFISGYRGSPLGGYDQALWAASKHLKEQHIVFQPGVNEELAATACWGTQQLGFAPQGSNRYDGVFGIWYGKGPGVDRCSDVFKHANMAGTTPWGGVLAVAGDDHISKSSTAAHQSDHIFKACGLPVFFPAGVQDILDLGVHAFALSRYAGVWSGMKTIQEIVESSAAVDVDAGRVQIVLPEDFEMPPGGLHIRWPDAPLAQEERLMHYKWYAALAYIRANRLNHNVIEGPHDRYGIMASGKAYNDLRQALLNLGLDDAACRQLGIRVHKVGVVWPLEAQLTRAFAEGLQEILVVEEKRQVIEYQLKEELYNWRPDVRPNVVGKYDEGDGSHAGGEWSLPNPSANELLRGNADLNPALIARALVRRLQRTGILDAAGADMRARIEAQMALLEAKEKSMQELSAGGVSGADRVPWFCSGCPHNTSTVVPEGSRAMAGIGCHYMAVWMDRSTIGFTQMGGEGVPWVGQQPFSNEQHVFANLGDGTYFHSGIMAIRQSVAAGVNITYKILYNDAVAMTGGQRVGERPEGHSVLQIAESMHAEGVSKLVIVSDEPEKYENVAIAGHPQVYHRNRLDEIQRELRETPGTTVMIYDQTCATEKRRRRKRGKAVDPARRVIINEAVCEGCGDCSVQSNCISVEPLETEFGRKRAINQSTCNKDFSCLRGFCPSFVTVEGGELKKKAKGQAGAPSELGELPEPALPALAAGRPWGIVVAGVGGTGVITIGQLLGVAAHLEGKGIVTQDAAGLAQKGGATWSHVLIGQTQDDILTTRVGTAAADLILACDPMVAVSGETMARMREGRTHVALNSHGSPTAAFVKNANWENPQHACAAQLEKLVGEGGLGVFDADAAARALMGDTIFINPMILGYAWQQGWIPLAHETLARAIELNGVAVKANLAAFEWGRQAAARPQAFEAYLARVSGQPGGGAQVIEFRHRETVDSLVARRVEFLTGYQDAAYARAYQAFVERVREVENRVVPGKSSLAEAAARYLFKLMAYKDEYEVARLQADPAFLARIQSMFEGEMGKDYQLHYHLAPPLTAERNAKGELQKKEYGPRMLTGFRWLAKLKGLRGGALDFFGRSEERKTERELIAQYRASLEEVLGALTPGNHATAVDIARVPEQIKGYGHVKERNLKAARARWDELMQAFRKPAAGERVAA
ncbi:MAG TPA: indolepyruvate ferredoxin oxidoreductase family protein [Ottowia sp.]|nr:indolepyruvate ferredoxin oxidoreductase family protein [Ottowia sp.]